MDNEPIRSIARDLGTASSTAVLRTRLWLWYLDEDFRWHSFRLGQLCKWLARTKISVPVGFSFASLSGFHTLGAWRYGLQAIRWPAVFSSYLLPTDVLRLLNNGLWQPTAMRLFISRRLNIKYCIIINDGNSPVAVARRFIFPRKREAFHHRMVTVRRYQRRRLTGKMMENSIALYEKLGIVTVKLVAGLSGGSMVWPKFGFRPLDEAQWKKIHDRIRKNLSELDESFKRSFEAKAGEGIEAYVEDSLANGDPRSIWDLSALDDDWAYPPNTKQGLGSFLLKKTRWKGILDLKDTKARAILDPRLEDSKDLGLLQ